MLGQLTFSLLPIKCAEDVMRRLRPQTMTGQRAWINQLVKILNSTYVLDSLLNPLLKLTLKLRTLFYYKIENYVRLEG